MLSEPDKEAVNIQPIATTAGIRVIMLDDYQGRGKFSQKIQLAASGPQTTITLPPDRIGAIVRVSYEAQTPLQTVHLGDLPTDATFKHWQCQLQIWKEGQQQEDERERTALRALHDTYRVRKWSYPLGVLAQRDRITC